MAVYPGAEEDKGNRGAAKSKAEETEKDRLRCLALLLDALGVCKGSSSPKESLLDDGGPEGEEEPMLSCEEGGEEAREPSSRESRSEASWASKGNTRRDMLRCNVLSMADQALSLVMRRPSKAATAEVNREVLRPSTVDAQRERTATTSPGAICSEGLRWKHKNHDVARGFQQTRRVNHVSIVSICCSPLELDPT